MRHSPHSLYRLLQFNFTFQLSVGAPHSWHAGRYSVCWKASGPNRTGLTDDKLLSWLVLGHLSYFIFASAFLIVVVALGTQHRFALDQAEKQQFCSFKRFIGRLGNRNLSLRLISTSMLFVCLVNSPKIFILFRRALCAGGILFCRFVCRIRIQLVALLSMFFSTFFWFLCCLSSPFL